METVFSSDAKPTPDSNSSTQSVSNLDSRRQPGGETLAKAAQSAHSAIDATVDRIAPVIDGVHDKVEAVKNVKEAATNAFANGKQAVGERIDDVGEWIDSAREAVRKHPLAAIGAALLVGAAYKSLTARRD